MNSTTPQFLAPSPTTVAKAVTRRQSGVVYSTSTPSTMGEAVQVESRLSSTEVVAAELRTGMPARTRNIRRPQVAKRPFSRLSAPEFDPALATSNPGR